MSIHGPCSQGVLGCVSCSSPAPPRTEPAWTSGLLLRPPLAPAWLQGGEAQGGVLEPRCCPARWRKSPGLEPQVCTLLPGRSGRGGRPRYPQTQGLGDDHVTAGSGGCQPSSPPPTGGETHPDPWLYPAARAEAGDTGLQDLSGYKDCRGYFKLILKKVFNRSNKMPH